MTQSARILNLPCALSSRLYIIFNCFALALCISSQIVNDVGYACKICPRVENNPVSVLQGHCVELLANGVYGFKEGEEFSEGQWFDIACGEQIFEDARASVVSSEIHHVRRASFQVESKSASLSLASKIVNAEPERHIRLMQEHTEWDVVNLVHSRLSDAERKALLAETASAEQRSAKRRETGEA